MQTPANVDPLKLLHQRPRIRGAPAVPRGRGAGLQVASGVGEFKSAVPIAPISREAVDAQGQKINGRDYQRVSAVTMEAENGMIPLAVKASKMYFMSYEELQQLSAAQVTIPQTSGIGSCNDRRLGVEEDDELCGTCEQTNMDCPGHLGFINLNHWYINPLAFTQAIYVLQCVCNSCGRLLINEEDARAEGLLGHRDVNRLKAMAEVITRGRGMQCQHHLNPFNREVRKPCTLNPKFSTKPKYDYIIWYTIEGRKGEEKHESEMSVKNIDDIFQRIPPNDLRLMGFEVAPLAPGEDGTIPRPNEHIGHAHPRNFILKAFPVVPPIARPHVVKDGEMRHDFLTTSYADIVRANNTVQNLISSYGTRPDVQKNLKDAIRCLYYFISHFIDNKDGKYKRAQEEPIQSVVERLKGKDGYIRGFAMGKRNDFTLRTVIGPRRLRFGEVGYPQRSQMILTKPVIVTDRNRQRILREYKAGNVTHLTPGSGELKGRRFRINERTRAGYTPEISDTVDLRAENGDETIFNRQPTLHKQSFMCYRARYDPYETIGLHSSYTTPHNADFDGDEGNKHKLQTIAARTEARFVASVEDNVMNAQANRPMIGMVYNAISSSYMMTQNDVQLDEEDWNEALQNLDDRTSIDAGPLDNNGIPAWASLEERLARYKIPARSGKALFSTLLPPDFYYNSSNKFGKNVEKVRIRDGILVEGSLTKKQVGPALGSIIHVMWKMYSKERVARFITECQYMTDWFIEMWGLTIGYKDCVAPNADQVTEIINREVSTTQLQIEGLGPETPDMTPAEKDFREKKVQSFLNNLTRIGTDIGLEALAKDNPLNIMGLSGAKGNETNTAQITGLLGQQFIRGQRPKKQLNGGRRTLPYFEFNSNDIEASGFIYENFMKGTKPSGMFFHMCASREGLINTAVKTSESGHLHHKLNKSFEDVSIHYDGSVRNVAGAIFQYVFSDGFDAGNMIVSDAQSTGPVVSFIDLKTVIGRLNVEESPEYDYV